MALTVSPTTRVRGRTRARRPQGPTGAGSELLERLRGDATRRPRVDPELAGGLREWLEDGAAEALADAPSQSPIIVDRWALMRGGPPGKAGPVTMPLARGALIAVLFRQFIVTARIGNATADALAALRAQATDAAIVDFVLALPAQERAALEREVASHASLLVASWPLVVPGWLPRTADRVSVPLAGGRIVLTGLLDLVLGAPAVERQSVCLVDVRSGEPSAKHRDDRHFHGLLETLRSGAPPFRVATYYTASGELDVDDVDDELLFATLRQTIERIRCAVQPPAVPLDAA